MNDTKKLLLGTTPDLLDRLRTSRIMSKTMRQAADTIDDLARDNISLRTALVEASLQLEYLESRWPTGTSPGVIARVNAALNQSESSK